MRTVKYDPLLPARAITNLMDEFWGKGITNFIGSDHLLSHPSVNIRETDAQYSIELAAPGLAKEDFKVHVDQGQLTVSANREKEEQVQESRFTRREFNYMGFSRSFQLPESVDEHNISARYENGVLELTLPKKEEAKPTPARLIEIG